MSLKIENSRRVAKSRPVSVWTFIKRHYIIIATIINAKPKGGFPVLARSSSQLAASACMSTFIQSQC